ncbi:MAG: type IVB secretion system apparatus protein IcmL/DotI [Rhodospirillales bacterium]|nr:type IVB secretion system apparatus protein IcmL/DotI [Alphaproteobacteria bacterium]MCB9986751.1 type IVB secretion system apparatus protein IcmL/DotI [Rhodospirillales bacterium]USO08481.1 MAG: type IVB secretion system apparatus protein IcmL/DotI [Rhodospirillales bacterium]
MPPTPPNNTPNDPKSAPRPSAAQARAAKVGAGKGVADAEARNAQTGLGRIVVRNEFYRDGYRTMLRVALIEAIAVIGLIIAMIVIVYAYQPENRYFATTEDGRVVPMVALSEPNLSRPALLSWASQAATETMTFGFHDYRRRLQEASRHFTRQGWNSFVKALQDSGIIEAVETNRQVVSAAPRAAPTILAEGVMNGVYQWQVEMPMMITYQFGSQQRNVSMTIRLVIVRVPRLESPNGVGIEQWLAYGS